MSDPASRLEDEDAFVQDLYESGMLHAAIVRSPHPKGRLLGVGDGNLPRGYSLVMASDVPGENRVEAFGSYLPILADGALSYVGEPVALIVGPDRSAVAEFARRCPVVAEPQEPDFSTEKFPSDRLAAKRAAVLGDPEAAFEGAAKIVEGSYWTSRQDHWLAEPVGALATFAYDKLMVRLATQWPFHVRSTVSAVLDVREQDIVVRPTRMGVALDGRLWYPSLVAALAALAALVCHRPVRLLLSREEEFRFAPKRPAAKIRQRAAVDENGTLVALDAKIIVDVGAGAPFATELLDRLCLGAVGAYRCPNVRIEGYAVRTNQPPAGPLAGFGLSQAFFASESHVSRVAGALGVDAVEWRRDNALSRGDVLATGTPLKEQVPARELIDAVVSMSDYRRKRAAYELLAERRHGRFDGPLRGIGLSFAYQGNGFIGTGADSGAYTVEVTLEKEGTLAVRTSAVPGSPETERLWRRIAAEALSLEEDQVLITRSSTDAVPDSGPSTLSRNVTAVSQLIERCCNAIRKQRFRDPLPITVRRSFRSPKKLGWNGLQLEGNPFSLFSWVAAAVEVEVDPASFDCQVRGIWLCVDGGRIHAETKARSAMETAALAALAWAHRERVDYVDGAVPVGASRNYDLVLPAEAPSITVDFLWNDSAAPKGIGELPWASVPSAFAQALSQALNTSFDRLPIDAAAIRDALEEGS